MTQSQDRDEPKSLVKNPIAKFTIGFVAALCAAFVPRLGAMLAPGTSASITFLTVEYVIGALIFAVLIGAVIIIFEHNIPRQAKDTFIAALAIPALIAGTFNTADGVRQIDRLAERNGDLARVLAQQAQIPRSDAPIEIRPIAPQAMVPSGTNLPSHFRMVTVAYAVEQVSPPTGRSSTLLGVQIQQPNYVIVLDQAQTKDQALLRVIELRAKVPQAQAVQTDKGFLIIQGAPRPEGAAVLEAVRLKDQLKLEPRLQQVK
jgi:hypothetical protein